MTCVGRLEGTGPDGRGRFRRRTGVRRPLQRPGGVPERSYERRLWVLRAGTVHPGPCTRQRCRDHDPVGNRPRSRRRRGSRGRSGRRGRRRGGNGSRGESRRGHASGGAVGECAAADRHRTRAGQGGNPPKRDRAATRWGMEYRVSAGGRTGSGEDSYDGHSNRSPTVLTADPSSSMPSFYPRVEIGARWTRTAGSGSRYRSRDRPFGRSHR